MIWPPMLTDAQPANYLNAGRNAQTRELTNTWPKRALATSARCVLNALKPKGAVAFNVLTGKRNWNKPELKVRARVPVVIDSAESTCWRAALPMPATIMGLSEHDGGDYGAKKSKTI